MIVAYTRAELAASGDASNVRITPVLTPSEVLTNEHSVGRGTFARVAAALLSPSCASHRLICGITQFFLQ